MTHRLAALDGLRALCVVAVFGAGYHWLLPWGWIGVQVFYVLSGFLITAILVKERAAAEHASGFFQSFYLRRTFRIFPLYFAYLLLLQLASSVPGAVPEWDVARWFATTFTINFGLLLGHFDVHDAYAHLWSLAVEEQFYLLWPLVIWFVPASRVQQVTLGLVLLGPVVRALTATWFDLSPGQTYLASTSHVDAFAIGALVATSNTARLPAPLRVTLAVVGVTLVLGVAVQQSAGIAIRTLGYPEGLDHASAHLWGYSLINLCAALAIVCALQGRLSALGHPVLSYVGSISYGVYVLQRPIKGAYLASLEPTLLSWLPAPVVYVIGALGCLALSIGLAALSYRYFERPVLKWRDRRFPRTTGAPIKAAV